MSEVKISAKKRPAGFAPQAVSFGGRTAYQIPADIDVFGHLVSEDPGTAALIDASTNEADPLWLMPLIPNSVFRLQGVYALAAENDVDVLPLPPSKDLSDDERLFAGDFVTYHLLGDAREKAGPRRIAYFEALQQWLTQPEKSASGIEDLLAAAAAENRRTNGGSTPGPGLGEVAKVLSDGLRAHLSATLVARRPAVDPTGPISNALLIGAYGGDHIGDTAILGGVLRRLHERLGLRTAVLMSQRPAHTARLVRMLETPVEVEVAEYTFANIDRHLSSAQALVFAGGPLTDIPKQLIRHLYAAAAARRLGKPFLAEGIGPNAFPRKGSAVTARRMIKFADYLSIRTKDDASRPVVSGLDPIVGRDPAFDYLETRGKVLTRLALDETSDIDRLLAGTSDRPVVGLNIRPIGSLFTATKPGEDRARRTREIEDRMERELAAGLAAYSAQSRRKPCFVFFPMNAIQFGMCDLLSAYRIVRHLPTGVDARVWQADASLDAVVVLMRRLDTAITMRFHATIFALSQGVRPIGIDYRVGAKDKVAAVMEDAGEPDFCCRIDQLERDWIADRLSKRLDQ